MTDQLTLQGKDYVSSKRAAELSGYTQDYVGQLARSNQVDAQRIGGLWYVNMDSLLGYKAKAEEYKPEIPSHESPSDAHSLISFDGRDYISAARASEITGYHQDYVGQLARSGAILSRQVGTRWYVDRQGLIDHKKEKDGLLAAVQAQAVGIKRQEPLEEQVLKEGNRESYFTYTSENEDLLPAHDDTAASEMDALPEATPGSGGESAGEYESRPSPVPIRVISAQTPKATSRPIPVSRQVTARMSLAPRTAATSSPKGSNTPLLLGAGAAGVLTIVIVFTLGLQSLRLHSQYANASAAVPQHVSAGGWKSAMVQDMNNVGSVLERIFVPQLEYQRSN